MESFINGCRNYYIDEKYGIAEEIISFYPESYLNNRINIENYTPLNKDEIICEFILREKLGEGAFGSVRLGINKQTGEKVAIKILEKIKLTRSTDKVRLRREISILKKLRHPNIVQLYSVIETQHQIFLIMEYVKGQELYQYILLNKKMSEEEACFYFKQIISGIEYLQKLKISHRDIKSENILIEQNTKKIKIIDFGLSNTYGDKDNELLQTACGSPFYAPPEMLKGELYRGFGVDIWSVGIVLYAMICGFLPFEGEDNNILFQKIIDGNFSIPTHVSKQGRELLYQLLNKNPKKRITVSQIKKHPWIRLYSNGLSNDVEPTFNIGLYIDKYVIPIDEDIIDQMEQKFKLSKIKSRINVLSNKSNDYTTLYYLLLKKKIEDGKQSISDLSSDLFLKYTKDKRNLLSNYKNKLKNVINARKMGVPMIYDIGSDNKENLEKKNEIEKSQEELLLKIEKIQKLKKICTPINKSTNDLNKNKLINNSQSCGNIKSSRFNTYKNNVKSASPLKKVQGKNHSYVTNIKINLKKRDKYFNENLNKGLMSARNKNNKYKLFINDNAIYNENKKVYSATIPTNHIKKPNLPNKSKRIVNYNYSMDESIDNKYNMSEIMMITNADRNKINLNTVKKNDIKVIEISKEQNKKEIYDGISKEEINFNKKNNNDNENLLINIEERKDFDDCKKDKKTNYNSYNKNKMIPKYNKYNDFTKLNYINNLMTDEKTLDSFSVPIVNQDEYQLNSFNNTQNIVETSTFSPQTVLNNKIVSYNNKTNIKNEYKNKQENKAKNNKKNIYGYKHIMNTFKVKKDNTTNNSMNKRRNNSTKRKINHQTIDISDYKKKYIEINKDRRINLTKNNKKRNSKYLNKSNISQNNSIFKDSHNNSKNLSSFNPIDEYKNKSIYEDNKINNKTTYKRSINKKNIENNNNNKRNTYKIRKYNSIDSERIKLANTQNLNNEQKVKKINNIKNKSCTSNNRNNNCKKNLNTTQVITSAKMSLKRSTNKMSNNNHRKTSLKRNEECSSFLYKGNDLSCRNNKFLSNNVQPKTNTLFKNINFNMKENDIKNKNKKMMTYKNKNLFNLKEYSSEKYRKNINNNDTIDNDRGSYEPFDLNCIFILPRKTIREKILKIIENIKYKTKQISAYKYNIIYGEKNIYEFSLTINKNIGIIKFKKIKGDNKDFTNEAKKIIYGTNKI